MVSLTCCDYTVFLEKFMPSVFIDFSNGVNLCVVLAFSPKLPHTVLFNFPVLILNMLLYLIALLSVSGICPFKASAYQESASVDALGGSRPSEETHCLEACCFSDLQGCRDGAILFHQGRNCTGTSAKNSVSSVCMGCHDKIPEATQFK